MVKVFVTLSDMGQLEKMEEFGKMKAEKVIKQSSLRRLDSEMSGGEEMDRRK